MISVEFLMKLKRKIKLYKSIKKGCLNFRQPFFYTIF